MHLNRVASVLAAAALLALSAPSRADEAPIQDNSFLLEEAYNQEPGVIQHISAFNRTRAGAWAYSFTEEWPVRGQTHQASVTLTYAGLREPRRSGMGDVALNYRWQALGSGDAPVAISPRLSALLPTGDASCGLGTGGTGLQMNLPMSVVLSERFVAHTNVGGTWVPSAVASAGGRGPLTALAAGQSVVWLAHRRVNVLAEALYTRADVTGPAGAERSESLTVNPGVRAAFDLAGGLQIVPGLSFPVGVGPSRGERAVFLYLSFEHPFRLAGPTEEEERGPPRR
jgi:hypothetical protein